MERSGTRDATPLNSCENEGETVFLELEAQGAVSRPPSPRLNWVASGESVGWIQLNASWPLVFVAEEGVGVVVEILEALSIVVGRTCWLARKCEEELVEVGRKLRRSGEVLVDGE